MSDFLHICMYRNLYTTSMYMQQAIDRHHSMVLQAMKAELKCMHVAAGSLPLSLSLVTLNYTWSMYYTHPLGFFMPG